MSQLAGKTGVAVNNFAVNDDAAAETGAQGQDDEVLHTFRGTEDHLTKRCRIGVVGDTGLKPGAALRDLHHGNDPLPPQVGRQFDGPLIEVGIGSSYTDTDEMQARLPRRHLLQLRVKRNHKIICKGIIRGREPPLGMNLTVSINKPYDCVRSSDVNSGNYFFHIILFLYFLQQLRLFPVCLQHQLTEEGVGPSKPLAGELRGVVLHERLMHEAGGRMGILQHPE